MTGETVRSLVEDMVALNRAAGFDYKKEERVLGQFARFCETRGDESVRIDEEGVREFLYGRGHRASTVHRNELVMRSLAEFAHSRGHDAWSCDLSAPVRHVPGPPYVFTDDEVVRLFSVIDGQEPSPYTNAAVVDPVLFRVLYDTGMRLSEALGLAVADADLEAGTLLVRNGKNGRDRLLPIPRSLVGAIARYMPAMHPTGDGAEYLFYAREPMARMNNSTPYVRFRAYLNDADIPHYPGGPHIHSLRHGFAVGRLKAWAREGADLAACLPRLSAYMGHVDLRATQYYLRLTADMYPEIAEAVQLRFGYVIPEGGVL